MENSPFNCELELTCVIVNFGMGSKIIKHAKQYGISGGTIFLGKGTINNSIMQLLELAETRKEIVLMAADISTSNIVMEELDKKFHFFKPNHGIVFSTTITGLFGTKRPICADNIERRGVKNKMHKVIFIIVDKGKAESVVEAATRAGSKGATIINARGSGIHETSKLFNMEIQPEKEIVLIISETNLTEVIVEAINDLLEIDKPGNGIIFIQDANKTYGLY